MYLNQMKFAHPDLAFENYNHIYQKLHREYGDVAPFSTYYTLISKYKATDLQSKALNLVQSTFDAFKDEHQQKLFAKNTEEVPPAVLDYLQIVKDNLSSLEKMLH
jgi:hypothetical protein